MTSCENCRFTFWGKIGEERAKFCRGAPPVPMIQHVRNEIKVFSQYPLVPAVPCGAFKRRWFGTTPSVDDVS